MNLKWVDQELEDLDRLCMDLTDEHLRQIKKWGVQVHTPAEWLMFLTEEVGELSEAISEAQFRGAPVAHIRDEAIQVATLALKIAEMADQGIPKTEGAQNG